MTAAFSGPFSGTRRRRNKGWSPAIFWRAVRVRGPGPRQQTNIAACYLYKYLNLLLFFGRRGEQRGQGRDNEIGQHQGGEPDQEGPGDVGKGAAIEPGLGRAHEQ